MIRRLALLACLAYLPGCTVYDYTNSRVCGDGPPALDGHTSPWDEPPGATPDAGDARDASITPSVGCTTPLDCATGETCVEGACLPIDATCQFDVDCGLARACVDNACRPVCSAATTCTAGTACTDGTCRPVTTCVTTGECAGGALCVDGRCLAPCTASTDCGTGELCSSGVCRQDVAPHPFCATDADCALGSICVAGACRIPCPTGTDVECQRSDVILTSCASRGAVQPLCYTSHQASPECATMTACADGLDCVDGVCR